jgi:hypothetical protein
LDENITVNDRPFIARELIESWKQQCGEDFKDAA